MRKCLEPSKPSYVTSSPSFKLPECVYMCSKTYTSICNLILQKIKIMGIVSSLYKSFHVSFCKQQANDVGALPRPNMASSLKMVLALPLTQQATRSSWPLSCWRLRLSPTGRKPPATRPAPALSRRRGPQKPPSARLPRSARPGR
jgi:hypothetical protein